MGSCTTDIRDDQRITMITPNHYSEFQDSIPASYPPVCKNNLWDIKDEGGRISDTLLNRLRLDPAGINQEWLECSDLSPLANVDKCAKKRLVLYGASLAAFHLVMIEKKSTKVIGRIEKIWICSRHGLTTPSRLLSSKKIWQVQEYDDARMLAFSREHN